ncbi:MAG: hypothetical protein WCL14_08335 [Bacteroidota bacterium]
MENLGKIIKKLSDIEYQSFLNAVTGGKRNKPHQVLELLRENELTDAKMMEILDVNTNAYYTLKSRLIDRISAVMNQKPVNALKEKVANVGHSIFDENKFITINYLKELSKELTEYDLSNELIVVYKALARLHINDPEHYTFYNRLYDKHVAYWLSVEKAEDLLYIFIRELGNYNLTRDNEDLDRIMKIRRELFNIGELYSSHRLYVLNNIVSTYFHFSFYKNIEELKSKEGEIEIILHEFAKIFAKYELDPFYQNVKVLLDILYVQLYYCSGDLYRSIPYYKQFKERLPSILGRHAFNFFIIQLLNSKLEKFLLDDNILDLSDMNSLMESNFEIETNEIYNLTSYKMFLAYLKYYENDFDGAIKIIEDLREKVSYRHYNHMEIEMKLFLAVLYASIGNSEVSKQLFTSISRHISLSGKTYTNAELLIKLLKTVLKPSGYKKNKKSIEEIYDEFLNDNNGDKQVLRYLRMNELHFIRISSFVMKA